MQYNYQLFFKLKNYAHKLGIKEIIYLDKTLKEDWGIITYEKSRIQLNCPTMRDNILSFIHEIGHWLSYLRHNKKFTGKFHYKKYREKMAYLYGWSIIKKLKLDISKKQWRYSNSGIIKFI